MPCTSNIEATLDKSGHIVGLRNARGQIEYKYKWTCDGTCPDKKTKCAVIEGKPDQHGGVREWCGCPDEHEPPDCHLVVYKPGKGTGGGPPEVICAGAGCPEGKHCPEKPSEKVVHEGEAGKVVEYLCECVADV